MVWFRCFFQAEDGIRDIGVTGVQTCALPISDAGLAAVTARGAVERHRTMLMTHSHKLSDKQLMLLSAASQRHNRLLALPEILKGAAARALVSKLLAGGLVEEITVSPADPYWRTSEDDQMIGLRITPTGLE